MAVKGPSPLLGFNTNVRHKGKVFHIQTEDSGVGHPHVITHLFADGGRILKSKKTSYSDHVGKADVGETVKKLMKEQHKEMFLLLQSGAFDEPAVAAPPDSDPGPFRTPAVPEAVPEPAPPPVAVAESAPVAAQKTPPPVEQRPVIDLTPGRYSQTRAPEIFRTPDKSAPSLFGEQHISEKSLDEVILSYLAEDLGED